MEAPPAATMYTASALGWRRAMATRSESGRYLPEALEGVEEAEVVEVVVVVKVVEVVVEVVEVEEAPAAR